MDGDVLGAIWTWVFDVAKYVVKYPTTGSFLTTTGDDLGGLGS